MTGGRCTKGFFFVGSAPSCDHSALLHPYIKQNNYDIINIILVLVYHRTDSNNVKIKWTSMKNHKI